MFSGDSNVFDFNLSIIIAAYFRNFIFLTVNQDVSLFIFLDALRIAAL